MAKFRVGEPARFEPVGPTSPGASAYGGQEVTVVEVGPIHTLIGPFDYSVEANDGQEILTSEDSLRKLTGSWDEIERLTGWRPGKSKQRKPEREAA